MASYKNCSGRIAVLMLLGLFLAACEGDDGNDGAAGPAGPPGEIGPPGPVFPAGAIVIGDGSALTDAEIATLGKLQATITSVTVNSELVVEFTVTDGNGDPANGIAEGVVWFTFAKLMPADTAVPSANGGLPYWQSYVNRVEDVANNQPGRGSDVLDVAVQATTDSQGALEDLGDGDYRYTFATDVANVTDPIAVAWEPDLTHRVGLEIRLDGDGETPLAPFNPVYDWVPNGGVVSTKAIADTNNCQNCHFEFTMHGGPRKTVEYCVTCHNPGTVDQDSGESLDMSYLAHSIHMGNDRQGANPFIIWGFSDFDHDYSDVGHPQSKTYCETCHTASMTHPDGDNWNLGATAKSCASCHADGLLAQNHDPVTGVAEYQFDHAMADLNVGVMNDGTCAGCHLGAFPVAGDALSIHSRISGDQRFREALGEDFVFEIISANNTGLGETPVITFKVSHADGTPYDILNDPEFTDSGSALNLYVAWNTDDIYNGDELGMTGGFRDRNRDISNPPDGIADIEPYGPGHPHRMYLVALQRDIAANPGWVNPDGSYTVTYFTSIPADSRGDAMISLGGHPSAIDVVDADGVVGVQRAAAVSAVFYPGAERDLAFDSDNCNACHKQLQFHGANRNGNVAICLNCHNADLAEGGEGFAFGRMVHSIHSASDTFAGGAFEHVKYPQNVANCDTCHVPGSYDVPRVSARSISIDGGLDDTVWTDDAAVTPAAANCGVCHDEIAVLGHFTSQGGQVGVMKSDILTVDGLPNGHEACAVCHGPGAEFETSKYHNPGIE